MVALLLNATKTYDPQDDVRQFTLMCIVFLCVPSDFKCKVCVSVCVCVYVCMYVCMYVHVCMYMYVCMYVCMYMEHCMTLVNLCIIIASNSHHYYLSNDKHYRLSIANALHDTLVYSLMSCTNTVLTL